MDLSNTLALMLGVAWASGVRLYATVLVLGLAGQAGIIALPAPLQVLSEPWVIATAAVLCVIELLADKVPGFDTLWDALHTFIRIPAGALLAFAAAAPVDPVWQAVALLLGGSVAAASHGTKMATRALINTSPEPFSNWAASGTEDVGVLVGLYLAFSHPWLFLALLAGFIVLVLWLLPKIWRALKAVARRIGGLTRA
ncbi:MAG: DUF4126 domain-containing protein [Rhodocyclaceae bacterium]|nr:DUF4126 domain-containing protein [Rhodocyclaceae bacterium]MBX3666837.1 DUF4126 domain-containing protein [Rhodocyclaceae bacterium]